MVDINYVSQHLFTNGDLKTGSSYQLVTFGRWMVSVTKKENRGEGGAVPNLSMAGVSQTFPGVALVCQEEGEQSNSLIACRIRLEIFVSLPVKHFELSKPLDVRGGLGATPLHPPHCRSRAAPPSCRRTRGGSSHKLPLVNSGFGGFTS